MPSSLLTLLLTTNVSEYARDVPVVQDNDTVLHAIDVLVQNSKQITQQEGLQKALTSDLCASQLDVPVVTTTTEEGEPPRFEGFVTIAQLLQILAERIFEISHEKEKKVKDIRLEELKNDEVMQRTLVKHAFWPMHVTRMAVSNRMSVLTALDIAVCNRIRRVATLTASGEVRGVLDSACVMNDVLASHPDLLLGLLSQPATALRPSHISWISTADNHATRVVDCLEIMNRKHIEALAIVHPTSRQLVGEFSIKDLNGFSPATDDLSLLFDSVSKWKQVHGTAYNLPSYVSADASVTVKDVWDQMVVEHADRVYLVNDLQHLLPINIYSRLDVLTFIFKSLKKE